MPQSKKTKWNTWKMFTNDTFWNKKVRRITAIMRSQSCPVISFDSLPKAMHLFCRLKIPVKRRTNAQRHRDNFFVTVGEPAKHPN
jgi:hypothetical protein